MNQSAEKASAAGLHSDEIYRNQRMNTIKQYLANWRVWMGAIVSDWAGLRTALSCTPSRAPARGAGQPSLRALSLCWLMACLIASLSSAAQAGMVETRVLPKHQYTNGGLTPASYDTPGAAFSAGKPNWDRFSEYSSVTSINLRPATTMGAPYFWLKNGVTYWHMSDQLVCSPPNGCVLYGGSGFGIQTNLHCPPGFGIAHEFDVFYNEDQKLVCLQQIDTPEPCDDCGRGNPVLPSTGQKLQVETDYVSPDGGLKFQRTYRSTNGYFTSQANSGSLVTNTVAGTHYPSCYAGFFLDAWGVRHDYCFPYASSNAGTFNLIGANGRTVVFSGASASITGSADNNDRLSQRINGEGALEWVLLRADGNTDIYNAQGLMVRSTSRSGSSDVRYSYSDPSTPTAIAPRAGLLTRMTDQGERQLNFSYDAKSHLIGMTDPVGGAYQYAYDANGDQSSVTYPDGAVRAYRYNEVSNINAGIVCPGLPGGLPRTLTGIVDENNQRFADFRYACDGKAVATEHAGGVDKYSFTYAGATTEVDPVGTTRSYNYTTVLDRKRPTSIVQPGPGGVGTVSSSKSYDANGNVSTSTDFSGKRTTYTYDLSRNLETSRIEAVGTAQARTISSQWHPSYRLPTKIAEPLRLTTNAYDPSGNLLSQTEQATTDATGTQGFAAVPSGTPRTSTYTYNAWGQVLTSTDPNNRVTSYSYYADTAFTGADPDAVGHTIGDLQSITNAAGHVTSFTLYDKAGRVRQSVDAKGITTDTTYTPRGWVSAITVTPPGGTARSTTYNYDGVGQLKVVTQPDGTSVSYSYDAAHRLIGAKDAKGNEVAYTLDNAGNHTAEQIKDPSGVLQRSISRIFDALSRVQQVSGAAQ